MRCSNRKECWSSQKSIFDEKMKAQTNPVEDTDGEGDGDDGKEGEDDYKRAD